MNELRSKPIHMVTKPVLVIANTRRGGEDSVPLSSHFIGEQVESQSMSESHSWSLAEPSLKPDPSKGTLDGAVTQRGH